MDNETIKRDVEHREASRPGPKTLGAVVILGLVVYAIYHWSEVKAAIDLF